MPDNLSNLLVDLVSNYCEDLLQDVEVYLFRQLFWKLQLEIGLYWCWVPE